MWTWVRLQEMVSVDFLNTTIIFSDAKSSFSTEHDQLVYKMTSFVEAVWCVQRYHNNG